MKKTITLLLPTLNEIDGLREIFPKLDRSLFDEILIVDGHSTDGTIEFAKENNIRLIFQKKKGLAAAVLEAIEVIKTDCVIEFSMDGNCMVEQLPELVQRLQEGNDLVVVSRYLPPAKSFDDNLITAFGNFMFTQMIRLLGKAKITDALTIYRGFDLKIVHYPEFKRFLYGPVFEPLISAVATARNLKIYEIAGDEPKRIGGRSKMSVIYNGSCILSMITRMYYTKFIARAC